jgi:hypothetical protein
MGGSFQLNIKDDRIDSPIKPESNEAFDQRLDALLELLELSDVWIRAETQRLEAEISGRDARLAMLLNSKSWRFTQPARLALTVVRSLSRLLRPRLS